MGSGRILIVDDDRLFRTYACDILKPEGYQVWTAATGEEAFRILKQDRFDIIIVDVVMENLSGLDLVRRIREADPEQEIIMVTGLEDVRTAVEAMKLGVSDYILKPIDPHGFLFLIDKLLSRRNLALEHSSLVLENLEYFETLSVYDRGMKFLEILDPDRLAEVIIDSIMSLTNGQGGIIWLKNQAEPQKLQLFSSLGLVRVEDEPVYLPFTPVSRQEDFNAYFPESGSRNVFIVPLLAQGEKIGVLKIFEKQDGTDFRTRDLKLATVLSGFAGIAIKNAFRFREMENRTRALPKQEAILSLEHFREAFDREINRSQRYRRNFSLVRLVMANHSRLQKIIPEPDFSKSKKSLLENLTASMRESDLLGALNEEEYLILLPETDCFDSIVSIRRLKEELKEAVKIKTLGVAHSWQLLAGASTYPRDGEEFSALNRAASNQVDKSRRSLVQKANCENLSFWEILDFLIQLTPESEYVSKNQESHYPLPFDLSLLRKVVELITSEALNRPLIRGVLLLNEAAGTEMVAAFLKKLASREILPGINVKFFLLGAAGPEPSPYLPITQLEVEDPRLPQHPFVFFLGERTAYSFLGRLNGQKGGTGFHSADPILAELLIHKFRQNYQLNFQI
jgi:DNA-binding response OmpR family regulator/GGDEF domain-containing protein